MANAEELLEQLKTNPEMCGIYSAVCKKDFKSYILTMFYLVNGSKYKLKPFHLKVMKALQDIVEGKNTKRNLALCLPVGAGKSLLTEYFITWCFARSVDNAFLYVAYSDRLINKLSKESKDIITSEPFQILFKRYLKKDDRQKINYSFVGAKNRTGLTAGTMSSALTGCDVANPNVEGFSGALIIDDPISADEAVYPTARENVLRVYDEKLATRRRTATAPTILIMQRVHMDDLVGWTKQVEPDQWEYVEIPALDENDNSFWEERYPAKDLIRMRDINPYKFQAQYQQNPIITGGQIIKSEWFQYYQSHPKYEKTFITADTAMKTGQHNDYSVLGVWGVYQRGLYLIDIVRGKWEAPELLQNITTLSNKYWLWEQRVRMSALYIEDKASGVGLIQQMKRTSRVPVLPIKVIKDKVSRVEEVLPFLEAGGLHLPFSREYGQNPHIISESELFARDMSHKHDDIVDMYVHAINVSMTLGRPVSIFET